MPLCRKWMFQVAVAFPLRSQHLQIDFIALLQLYQDGSDQWNIRTHTLIVLEFPSERVQSIKQDHYTITPRDWGDDYSQAANVYCANHGSVTLAQLRAKKACCDYDHYSHCIQSAASLWETHIQNTLGQVCPPAWNINWRTKWEASSLQTLGTSATSWTIPKDIIEIQIWKPRSRTWKEHESEENSVGLNIRKILRKRIWGDRKRLRTV